MRNKDAYESKDVVRYYSTLNYLFEPEKRILNNFKKKLRNMKMLDIGVGGGRTTYYFSGLTKSYVGIDNSRNMIAACKSKFFYEKNVSFEICDVKSMKIFKNNSFDFILFSFNGIDYLSSNEDRLKALQEIKRICKKGGFFCFSTHNIQNIDRLFQIQFSGSMIRIFKNILRYFLIKFINNTKKLKDKEYVIINDGGHNFRLLTYYIGPEKQIKQLKKIGFKNIKVYSTTNGKKIGNEYELNTIKDNFLYYLCNA